MLVTEQLNVPILVARAAFRIRDDVIEVQVGGPEAPDVAAHAAVTKAHADLDVLRDVTRVGACDRVRGDEAQRLVGSVHRDAKRCIPHRRLVFGHMCRTRHGLFVRGTALFLGHLQEWAGRGSVALCRALDLGCSIP